MKKPLTPEVDDLRAEYDLRALLPAGEVGKYAERYRQGTNVVLLEPDVAKEFRSPEAVNDALRLVIELTKIAGQKAKAPADR